MKSLILLLSLTNQAISLYSSNITCMQGLPDHVTMHEEVLQKINETVRNASQLMALETEMNNSMLCNVAQKLVSRVFPLKIRRIRSLNGSSDTKDTLETTKTSRSTISITPTLSSGLVTVTVFNESMLDTEINTTMSVSTVGQRFTIVPVTPPSVGGGYVVPRRRSRPIRPPVLPRPIISPSAILLFAYTLQLLAEQALQKRQSDCTASGGEYDNAVGLCKLYTSHNRSIFIPHNDTITDPRATYVIAVAGNGLSILCLILLLLVYTFIKSLRTRSGKTVMCLAVTMAVAQLFQLIGVHITKMRTACTVVGVVLHWAFLASFVWMTVISYDLLLTFAFPFQNIKMGPNSLFFIYIVVGLSVPTIVVAVCMVLHIINEDAIGYGVSTCFIGNLWANLYAYVMFVVFAMILNSVCLVVTMVKIHRGKQAAKDVQSRHQTSAQHRLQLTLMTLKVSTLTSLGWIFGLLGGFLGNSALTYIFVVLTSCQGIFIFVAFCCNSRIYLLLTAYMENKNRAFPTRDVSFVLCSLRNRRKTQFNGKQRYTNSSISSRKETEVD